MTQWFPDEKYPAKVSSEQQKKKKKQRLLPNGLLAGALADVMDRVEQRRAAELKEEEMGQRELGAPGQGGGFNFVLPKARGDDDDEEDDQEAARVVGKRIHVDDDDDDDDEGNLQRLGLGGKLGKVGEHFQQQIAQELQDAKHEAMSAQEQLRQTTAAFCDHVKHLLKYFAEEDKELYLKHVPENILALVNDDENRDPNVI